MARLEQFTFLHSVQKAGQPAPYSKAKDWLLALADRFLGPVRQSFLEAIAAIQNEASLKQIEELAARNEPQQIIQLLGIEPKMDRILRGSFTTALSTLLQRAGQQELLRMPSRAFIGRKLPAAEVAGLFNVRNPYAIDFLRNYESGLIRNVTRDTARNVSQIVRQAFEVGGHPRTQAKLIRDVVGLLPQQAEQLRRYEQTLQEKGTARPLLEKRVDAFAKKLATQRATVIARTETIRAANAGQDIAWKSATQANLLPPGLKRRWLVTRDDRLCPSCAAIPAMNPQGRGQDEPFLTPDGPAMAPPLHPNCRCAMSLIIDVPD